MGGGRKKLPPELVKQVITVFVEKKYVDAAGGDRADDFTWYHQLYLQLLYLLGIRKGGNDHASPPVWSHDGNAGFIF